jgi:hypothetical protein
LERIETGEPDSAVLGVEADRELLVLSLNEDGCSLIPSLLSKPRFCMMEVPIGAPVKAGAAAGGGEGLERICGTVRRRWGSRRFRRVEVLRISGGWQLYREHYAALAEALRGFIAADWGNAMTLVKLGRRYAGNFIRNLALIPRCPSCAALSFGRDPVLVLGAGPSLDPFLDSLFPRIREKRPFRILCVDTALPNLKARNLRPDLVFALECQHWNLRDFIGLRGWAVPLAMDLSALPAAAEVLEGPRYLFFTPWTDLNLFTRLTVFLPETFPPLGSVGLAAAAAALSLTGGPVILCGIDFSFTLDSYHARSTPGHKEKLRGQNRFKSILNQAAAGRGLAGLSKSGQAVLSDGAMRNYRDLFEREFAGRPRLWDIWGSGLPLGLPTLQAEEAALLLNSGSGGGSSPPAGAGYDAAKARRLREFIQNERGALTTLREILRGEQGAGELEGLLDYCDYLWAHFPECAATGGRRPPATDISFLKRVRTEIDPFIKLLDLSLKEC